ncbi:MAG: hypothetical protein ACREEE_02325 [Dongiaceae bacterium]
MPAKMPSRAIKLFGTDAPAAKRKRLVAGPLSVELDNGALRYVRMGDVEVLRAIAFLVRDENWGTFAPEITDLKVSQGKNSFQVGYNARCADARRAITCRARIFGASDGTLKFEATATPLTDFLTNRTGFIVLHPLKGVAGYPVEVEHVDGLKVKSKFPKIIDPVQPFRNIRALTHQVMPGLRATCRMEGDIFEMEDHRNWTDASFKTYVRPLAKPWPYTLAAQQEFQQSVTLSFTGKLPKAKGGARPKPIEVAIGRPAGDMPRIGIGVPAAEAAFALAAAEAIKAAGPQLLVCRIDGRQGPGVELMTQFRRLSHATGAAVVLEIVIPGQERAEVELAPIAAAQRASGLKPAAVVVSPAPDLKAVLPGSKGPIVTPAAEICRAARAAFSGIPMGGGMFSFFTELNRKRPPTELLDFVTHTTCPTVHAADDISVMETLEALPYVIESTRAFIGDKPYRVGSSGIPCRDNPYGAATPTNPNNGRVCMANMDPRQRGLFGAAWTLGYIAAFAEGGVEAVTMGAPTGPGGMVYRVTDFPQPYYDDLKPPAVYPLYHVLAGLAAGSGAKRVAAKSSEPTAIAVLAHRAAGGTVLWLANLTGLARAVRVSGLPPGAMNLRVIDETVFGKAATDREFLRHGGKKTRKVGSLQLGPYAVARLSPA